MPRRAKIVDEAPPREVDFVWVGCGQCWMAADAARPVRPYGDWLADGMRHRPFMCRTCSERNQHHTEVFPTLFAMAVSDWWKFREGEEAPEPGEDVKRFGG